MFITSGFFYHVTKFFLQFLFTVRYNHTKISILTPVFFRKDCSSLRTSQPESDVCRLP